MRVGVVFPQTELGGDVGAVRAYGEAVGPLGYRHEGRDPSSIGMEGRVEWQPDDPDKFVRAIERWREAGATHVGINTMNAGLSGVADHLEAISAAAKVLGLTS